MKIRTNGAPEPVERDPRKRPCRRGLPVSLRVSLCLLLAGLIRPPVQAQLQPTQPDFRADRILVKPKPGVDLSVWNTLVGTHTLRVYPNIGNLQTLQLPPGTLVADLLAVYRQSGLVEYAEPDYRIQIVAAPNDVRFADGTLWGLHNTGQLGGRPDADIDAPEAWDTLSDARNIIVAVIDTGIRATHEDLAGNLWVNPGESGRDLLGRDRRSNLVDDDGNGYIDDANGIDAILGIGMPFDDHGHGTHVAGTIGAMGNNGVGVVGVAWRVQLMACKFVNALGEGFASDAIECIRYARNKGARIINASWGDYDFGSTALHDAIASARNAGIIFVAATGNNANNNDIRPLFPASYDLDNIIAVAATDRQDNLAFFSNFGARTVDLAAPGHDVFSCWNLSNNDYRYLSGTSMAAPHVVGACALLWARFPNESYRQIISRVLSSVDPLPGLAGKCVTGGRLNLRKALGSGGVTSSIDPGGTTFTSPTLVPVTGSSSGENQRQFRLEGDPDRDYLIQASSDLQSWITILVGVGPRQVFED